MVVEKGNPGVGFRVADHLSDVGFHFADLLSISLLNSKVVKIYMRTNPQ